MGPALGCGNRSLYLTGSQLEPGEPIEDRLRAPAPAVALERHPVFEIRGVIQGEAFQELAAIRRRGSPQLLEDTPDLAAWCLHQRAGRDRIDYPQVQLHTGAEIQADRRVAPGAQVLLTGAALERLPEPVERVAQGRPALVLPTLGPEQRGELLTRVQTALGRQVEE